MRVRSSIPELNLAARAYNEDYAAPMSYNEDYAAVRAYNEDYAVPMSYNEDYAAIRASDEDFAEQQRSTSGFKSVLPFHNNVPQH